MSAETFALTSPGNREQASITCLNMILTANIKKEAEKQHHVISVLFYSLRSHNTQRHVGFFKNPQYTTALCYLDRQIHLEFTFGEWGVGGWDAGILV